MSDKPLKIEIRKFTLLISKFYNSGVKYVEAKPNKMIARYNFDRCYQNLMNEIDTIIQRVNDALSRTFSIQIETIEEISNLIEEKRLLDRHCVDKSFAKKVKNLINTIKKHKKLSASKFLRKISKIKKLTKQIYKTVIKETEKARKEKPRKKKNQKKKRLLLGLLYLSSSLVLFSINSIIQSIPNQTVISLIMGGEFFSNSLSIFEGFIIEEDINGNIDNHS